MKRIEVNNQIQENKRQQISEGVEMVSRIEALRKVLNDLQEQHKHFSEASKEELRRETTELFGQKEVLKADVETLTTIRAELQKPLDDKWKEVKNEESRLYREKEKLEVEKLELESREGTLVADRMIIDQKLEKISALEEKIEKQDRFSSEANQEAEKTLKDSQNKRDKTDEQIVKRLKEVEREEKAVDFEKQGVEQIKKVYALREKELNEKEKQVNDRYQTLLRAEKRNGSSKKR